MECLSAIHDTSSFVLTTIFDQTKHLFIVHLILDRSHLDIWIESISNTMFTCETDKSINKLLENRLMDIYTFHGYTRLPCIDHRAMENFWRDSININIFEQDCRVISSKLK